MACTRKKQCLYGDICPTARSDEYNLIDASCYKPLEQTNEEWFCQLSTEEKAYFLSVEAVRAISEYENNGTERTCSSFWEYWLKAVHKE